jgi:penicillin-binding protein A
MAIRANFSTAWPEDRVTNLALHLRCTYGPAMHRRTWLKAVSALGAWSATGRSNEAWAEELATVPKPQVQLDLSTLTASNGSFIGRTTAGDWAPLTLDVALQHCGQELLKRAYPVAGGALIVDIATGRLLCCAAFNRSKQTSSNHPLLTPAPAASVFKLVTTAALLDKEHVQPDTRVCFSGGERQIERHHLERPSHVDTCPPFRTALGFSRNAVFAQLATQHLLRQELLDQAVAFGFNRPLPFDVPTTVGTLDLPYNDLEFARAAAGFVGSALTPFGAAHLALTIAQQGRPGSMQLIAPSTPPDAGLGRIPPRVISERTASRLTRMMEVTVHSGTSLEAFSRPDAQSYLGDIRVAGKTGTLQRGKDAPITSWFTGFAPSRDPKFVVTVLLQNSPLWRRKANEVARDLLRAAFAGHRGVTHPLESPETDKPVPRTDPQVEAFG